MSRPVKILLIIVLVVFPPALLIPALPLFGLIYLWHLQDWPPAEAAMIATVYTIPFYLIAVAVFSVWCSRRRKVTQTDTAHSAPSYPQQKSLSEQDERKQRKRRRQAEAAGDLLVTLAFIDADKNRKK